jgi:hypothetical protein
MYHSSYFKVFSLIKERIFVIYAFLNRGFSFFSRKSNQILNKNNNFFKGKNATTAFANITQTAHTRKGDQNWQKTTWLKIFFWHFPCFLTKISLPLCEVRTFLEIS